jgi:cob(I)alamin adenosyltransferase
MLNFDEALFNSIVDLRIASHGLEHTYLNVLTPFMHQIGVMWLSNTICPAQEHFISNLIRQKLYTHIDKLGPDLAVHQDRLFVLGSWLAVEPGLEAQIQMPKISVEDIERLEKAMDEMESSLPALKHFILPGGHPAAAQAHVVRCICRRAERSVWELNHQHPVQIEIPIFLNRLSDYYFTLARWILQENGLSPQCWIPQK